MKRTPLQQFGLLAAALCGAAPLAAGLLQSSSAAQDLPLIWMSAAATIFAAGILAAAIGRRRSRRATIFQTTMILVVGTLLALGTARIFVSALGTHVWIAAAVIGLSLAAASILIAVSRPHQR
jgi:hypothetical protein